MKPNETSGAEAVRRHQVMLRDIALCVPSIKLDECDSCQRLGSQYLHKADLGRRVWIDASTVVFGVDRCPMWMAHEAVVIQPREKEAV